MRGRMWTGWGMAVLLLAGCGGKDAGSSADGGSGAITAPGAMAPGDSAQVGDQVLTFIGVANDARCPADVTCPNPSNALVRFTLRAVDQPGGSPTLHSVQMVGDSAEVTVEGLTFSVGGIEPARQVGVPIRAEEYRVTIKARKAATP